MNPAAAAANEDGSDTALAYDPTAEYSPRTIEGWPILLNKRLQEKQPLCDQTLRVLQHQLFQVTRVVPADALVELQKVPIWVELAHPRHPCMCYHPSADWLRSNGMNPEKAKAVEVANAENFLRWTHDQPWMVFHELAHAYHDRVLGFEHEEIVTAFYRAQEAQKYQSVLRISGHKARHYALTNPKEYFAECSEAYFGTNDFFPFVRSELSEYDPLAVEVLRKVWGVKSPP